MPNDETLVTADAPCPPVGVVCRSNGSVVGEHSEGYILTTCCDLPGAAVLTVLRNHLSTTVVRKSVLVSVVGNRAASKLLETILSIVPKPVESVKDTPLVGATNASPGRGKMAGDLSIGYFKAWTALSMGLTVIGEYTTSYIVLLTKCIYTESGGKVLATAPDDVDTEVAAEGACIPGHHNVG